MKIAGWLMLLAGSILFSSCPAKVDCFRCTTRIMHKKSQETHYFSEFYCGDQEEVELANTYEDEENMYFTSCR